MKVVGAITAGGLSVLTTNTGYTQTQMNTSLAAKQDTLNWIVGDSTSNMISTGTGRLSIRVPSTDGLTSTEYMAIRGTSAGVSVGEVSFYANVNCWTDLIVTGTIWGAGGARVLTAITGYMQTQMDTSPAGKADTSTTYTKTEVDTQVAAAKTYSDTSIKTNTTA